MTSHGLYLQWEGKRLYRQLIPTPYLLEPISSLSFGTSGSNMIIEGDNLQVLASLKSQYEGQVDVVYIDPPYHLEENKHQISSLYDSNIEDNDDVYITSESGGKHTKWLNFIAPRLYMLWRLLNDDHGVIFVSINDIELFHLGILLNEIFGEENHIGTLIWKGSTDNNPTRIVTEHEYILCYAKNKASLPSSWLSKQNDIKDRMLHEYESIRRECVDPSAVQKRFRAFIRENRASLDPLTHYSSIDELGPYTGSRKVHNPGKDGYRYDVIHPLTGKPCRIPIRGYRYPQETMQKLIDSNRIIFGPDEKQIVQIKVYLKDYVSTLKSVITDIDARSGSNALAEIFGDRNLYRNAKPVELIELILEYSTTSNSLILDAFAGSGTTAQAVLRLNEKDGGKRRFILIENGHATHKLCRTVTAERVKHATEKYNSPVGFTFYTVGQKIDRQAIIELERDALANLICQADETGRGRGITRLHGYKYIIGKNHRSEALCLVWQGSDDSEVTPEQLRGTAIEVDASSFKRPFRIYGTFCRVVETERWRFCQIPDAILAQMHIQEEIEGEEQWDA